MRDRQRQQNQQKQNNEASGKFEKRSDGTGTDIADMAEALEQDMGEIAKTWTPLMSNILKFGVFAMIFSNAMRLAHLCGI